MFREAGDQNAETEVLSRALQVRDFGMSSIHASRDLHVHENVLRKWIGEFGSDPVQAFQATGN